MTTSRGVGEESEAHAKQSSSLGSVSISGAADPSQSTGTTPGSTPDNASQSAGATSGGGATSEGGGRSTFGRDELAIVLSHYDIGEIEAIKAFPRGSRKAPKLVIRAGEGLFLLKRRASGRDDGFKVAFCHEIQLHLAEHQFPLPHLVGTRKDNNSMLQLDGAIYELFEYIKGSGYDESLEATAVAGKTLALFHKLLRNYTPQYQPHAGSYHNARSVARSMKQLGPTLAKGGPAPDPDAPAAPTPDREEIKRIVRFLAKAYSHAARQAEELGMSNWPTQIVHSDWHPGNVLYRGSRIVAVIDYDAARIHQRVIDTANGALQFAIVGGGADPAQWPDYLDESRYRRFIRGYDSVPEAVLSKAELRAVPWLMIEALIAESVIPVAATGSFARMPGLAFLQMVQRKVQWLADHAAKLAQVVQS